MLGSKIIIDEVIDNKDRKFGSDTVYYPVRIVISEDLEYEETALFTADQIKIAIERAEYNPEDIEELKEIEEKKQNWFKKFFN